MGRRTHSNYIIFYLLLKKYVCKLFTPFTPYAMEELFEKECVNFGPESNTILSTAKPLRANDRHPSIYKNLNYFYIVVERLFTSNQKMFRPT